MWRAIDACFGDTGAGRFGEGMGMARHRLALMAFALLLPSALPCCRREATKHPETPEQAPGPRRPNIIVLTVDTLRADHIASYGYVRDTMPAVEEFLKTAVVFDNAVVPRGSTRPSYASMLTGLYPFHHGVHSPQVALHESLVTLPEVLVDAGYHTAGFVSNFLMVKELSGLAQGFQVYDDRMAERDYGHSEYKPCERPARETVGAILEWLNGDPPQPFLLFTNLIDPHGPYHPPGAYRKLYHDSRVQLVSRDDIPDYLRVAGQFNMYDYIDRYDGEIRYTDDALGVLIDALKRRGFWDDALVIFTADHGECLGQHDIYFEHHYHVWEETMHVPLAIRLPGSRDTQGRTVAPRRLSNVCSPMDLTPSILDYLDLPCDIAFDGRSLLPLMEGRKGEDRALLLEYPDIKQPAVYAVRTATHKLMAIVDRKTGKVGQRAVFDMVNDRDERQGLSLNERDPAHRKLDQSFRQLVQQAQVYRLPFTPTVQEVPWTKRGHFIEDRRKGGGTVVQALTPEQAKRLRSLGYVH